MFSSSVQILWLEGVPIGEADWFKNIAKQFSCQNSQQYQKMSVKGGNEAGSNWQDVFIDDVCGCGWRSDRWSNKIAIYVVWGE